MKPDPDLPITEGHLLDGRVHYAQLRDGFRSGIEPVLLAAAVPARSGQRVLEAGTGAGAALLCLAARVPGVVGIGVERDRALAALARRNGVANQWSDLSFVTADITALPDLGPFDHACANPPYHLPGTRSPQAARESARRAYDGLFAAWIGALAAALRMRGTLTLVVTASVVPDCLAALTSAGCGSAALLPLWPKAGRAAKLALLHGVKGGRGPFRLLSGLQLHEASGKFTPEADAILRGGAELPWGEAG